ncbi:MAG: DnaA family protein [Cocleimonas sp.]|jgi:DnaA family protein
MSSEQLALNVNLKEGLRFESFFVEPDTANAELVTILQSFIDSHEAQQNLVWGESLSGKTHLLQACCAKQAEINGSVSYIPLKVLSMYGAETLKGLSNFSLVVIDDVDSVIGDKNWEIALFNLINQTRDKKTRLLLSSQNNPRQLNCLLPDLASRLIWGGSYQLHILSDEDKSKALKTRAEQRGFELSDRVVDYLFRHYPRDIESLMGILDKLDKESLRLKTIITVPFVKQTLNTV